MFVRNTGATVERAMQSVFQQEGPLAELLVLDGGSTDGTLDIVKRYEKQIAYWRSYPDGGPVYAINEGIRRATGDVICLLPADDWLEPGATEKIAREFAADPNLDILSCGTRIVRFDAGGTMHVDSIFTDPRILEFSMENIVRFPLTAARFMRRRVYERFGVHDSHYRTTSDLDFLVRICAAKLKSRVVPDLLYTYRRHPGSLTISGNPESVLRMMRDNVAIACSHLQNRALEARDRKALLGLHGRCSARLAWMLASRGWAGEAAAILFQAIRMNWRWPFWLPFWIARGWVDAWRFSGTRR